MACYCLQGVRRDWRNIPEISSYFISQCTHLLLIVLIRRGSRIFFNGGHENQGHSRIHCTIEDWKMLLCFKTQHQNPANLK